MSSMAGASSIETLPETSYPSSSSIRSMNDLHFRRHKSRSFSGELTSSTLDPTLKSHQHRSRKNRDTLYQDRPVSGQLGPNPKSKSDFKNFKASVKEWLTTCQQKDENKKNLLKKRLAESRVHSFQGDLQAQIHPRSKSDIEPRLLSQIDGKNLFSYSFSVGSLKLTFPCFHWILAAILASDDLVMDEARTRVRLALWKVVKAQERLDALKMQEKAAEEKKNDIPLFDLKFLKKIPSKMNTIPSACKDVTSKVAGMFSWLSKIFPEPLTSADEHNDEAEEKLIQK